MLLNLQKAMRARRLRACEVSDRTGISESRLSRATSGRAVLIDGEKQRLAKVLDAAPSWLFAESADIPPLSFEERILRDWSESRKLREEFGDVAAYAAYMAAVERGATRSAVVPRSAETAGCHVR